MKKTYSARIKISLYAFDLGLLDDMFIKIYPAFERKHKGGTIYYWKKEDGMLETWYSEEKLADAYYCVYNFMEEDEHGNKSIFLSPGLGVYCEDDLVQLLKSKNCFNIFSENDFKNLTNKQKNKIIADISND